MPGMHARVIIVSREKSNATVIPATAINERKGRKFVFVAEGTPTSAKLPEMKTGIRDGDAIEVLGGLDANAQVITMGSRLVKPGATVQVTLDEWLAPLATPQAAVKEVSETAGE